jgi:hypothetical protein
MLNRPTFPSREWCQTAARALDREPEAQAALSDLGPVTFGMVLERDATLAADFCVFVDAAPGRDAKLVFCDDEDELDDLEPDYLARAQAGTIREVLAAMQRGQPPDPLALTASGRVRLRGDLGRLVRVGGRHPQAGTASLRSAQLAIPPADKGPSEVGGGPADPAQARRPTKRA